MNARLDALAHLRAELVAADVADDQQRAATLRVALGEALTPDLLADLLDAARQREAHAWDGPVRAPYPYYGGKSDAAKPIEDAMGDIVNLVIPFGGSLGELFGRSKPVRVETVNDADGLIINAWRALQQDPEMVAWICDHPVHEPTMHAVHRKLVRSRERLSRLLADDEYFYDAELAAWWVWGRSAWLGTGWCHPQLGADVTPCLGKGIHAGQLPMLRGGGTGPGIGNGCHASTVRDQLLAYFRAISARLRRVRITCGDWLRVLTESVTTRHGLTGVVLDPPYSLDTGRKAKIYGLDDPALSGASREWAIEHGDDPLLRIVVCGILGEHVELEQHGWSRLIWRDGKRPECLWLSPHCRPATQMQLFEGCAR